MTASGSSDRFSISPARFRSRSAGSDVRVIPQRRSSSRRTGRRPTSVWNGEPISCSTTAWDRSARSTADHASRLFPIPASPRKTTPGVRSSLMAGLGPAGLDVGEFALPADHRAPGCRPWITFGDHLEVAHRCVHTLDRLGRLCFELESPADQRLDRLRHRDGAGIGDAADPCGEVGGQPVDVVLGGVEIDDPPVDADADARCRSRTVRSTRSLSSVTARVMSRPA